MKKQMMFKTKGMNQDLSVSAFNPEFAFENMNLRLSTNEGNTTMSWVNERGTSLMSIIINTRPDIKGEDRLRIADDLEEEYGIDIIPLIEEINELTENIRWIDARQDDPNYETILSLWEAQYGNGRTLEQNKEYLRSLQEQYNIGKDKYTSTEIEGIPIGTAVINHQLVLFTSQIGVNGDPNIDRIYVISKISNEEGGTLSNGLAWGTLPEENATYILQGTLLCALDLNFSPQCPIETIVSYESNAIQKVYWTDGKNQPRMINIAKDITEPYKSFSFDFIGELQLNEEVTVQKIVGGNGAFPAGVIQYAFTYYQMNGQESNIFYTTPLLYISPRDRGGRPDEKVDNVFKITINNIDTNYDYLRIYSIIRTSLNSTPLCKRVQDIKEEEAWKVKYKTQYVEDSAYGFLNYSTTPLNARIRVNDEWLNLDQYHIAYDHRISDSSFILYVDSNKQSQTLGTLGYDFAYYANLEDVLVEITNNPEEAEPRYITYKDFQEGDRLYVLKRTLTNEQIQETRQEYKVLVVRHSSTESLRKLLPYFYNDNIEPRKPNTTYTDTGYSGDSIDPTELLYKGGESIIAKTIEQKDNTLFLGNLVLPKAQANTLLTFSDIQSINIEETYRVLYPEVISEESGNYGYSSQLTAFGDSKSHGVDSILKPTSSVPCGGFKKGNTYRCGLQFQYKTGKWSEPIYVNDIEITQYPQFQKEPIPERVILPGLVATIQANQVTKLKNADYVKARAVIAVPSMQDRTVICQGVANPTLYTTNQRTNSKGVYAQSSWFFRAYYTNQYKIDDSQHIEYDREIQGNDREYDVTLSFKDENQQSYHLPYIPLDTNYYAVTYDINNDSYYLTRSGQQIEVLGWANIPNKNGTLYVASRNSTGTVVPRSEGSLEYTQRNIEGELSGSTVSNGYPDSNYAAFDPQYIRQVEIEGDFKENNRFQIDWNCLTFHSPDIEFNEQVINTNFNGKTGRKIGTVNIDRTLSSIDMQTETPTIGANGGGFSPKSFKKKESYGIVSGLFYDDWAVEDWGGGDITYLKSQKTSFKWLVYPWNSEGSLNNDFNRAASQGVQSSKLKKKVISNLRYASTTYSQEVNINDQNSSSSPHLVGIPQIFFSDETTIVKIGGDIYQGNIDTLLQPDNYDGSYFTFEGDNTEYEATPSEFTSTSWWKTFNKKETDTDNNGLWLWDGANSHKWIRGAGDSEDLGNQIIPLVLKKESVRMKYKSSPHAVFKIDANTFYEENNTLPIVEFIQNTANKYGGTSQDALKENIWIPCGEPVRLDIEGSETDIKVYYDYGDTYFQRWDCLKTYAFTPEDINQIVEIGSFMLETYMNIDGRYDRNRGQINNTTVSLSNFNLMNPVYSQLNNFFSYKIGSSYEENSTQYLNQITWTKTKESGADVDLWTNITLASVLELDGDKGEINKLIRFNDQLLAFQDTGISQILYNESVQVSTENGVPVELANSGKVQGKRYLSDTIGCSNKWSMTVAPSGIYFIDNHDRSIYLFNEGLTNISLNGGMDSWCKNNITLTKGWYPSRFLSIGTLSQEFVSYYDRNNKDVLFINGSTALAYSEKLGTFTSFYSYGGAPYLCTLDDLEIWINRDLTAKPSEDVPQYYLWQHQGSDEHCKMFEADNPYYTVLIGNPEPTVDKTFTNLDFRACVQGDGESLTKNYVTSFKNFYLPFDNIEVWNEYQHGISQLNMSKGRSQSIHNYINSLDAGDTPSPLSRKFRIWRCDIPRDNYPTGLDVKEYEAAKGITRFKSRPLDRIRNPWVYIKLTKDISDTYLPKAEIHDVVLTYFD